MTRPEYFLRYDICEPCGRYSERHICSEFDRWKAVREPNETDPVHPTVIVGSVEDWKDYLREACANGGKIVDDDGVEMSLREFIDRADNATPSEWDLNNPFLGYGPKWRDPQGHLFYAPACFA